MPHFTNVELMDMIAYDLYMLFTDEAFETVFLTYIILTCGVMKIHMEFILPVIDNNFLLMFGQVLLMII
jgi:hypothetical protein